jgi:hypothetical protein
VGDIASGSPGSFLSRLAQIHSEVTAIADQAPNEAWPAWCVSKRAGEGEHDEEARSVRAGSVVQVAGSIPITFADWSIPNPSFGGVVTTDDHGVLEFALNFAHA